MIFNYTSVNIQIPRFFNSSSACEFQKTFDYYVMENLWTVWSWWQINNIWSFENNEVRGQTTRRKVFAHILIKMPSRLMSHNLWQGIKSITYQDDICLPSKFKNHYLIKNKESYMWVSNQWSQYPLKMFHGFSATTIPFHNGWLRVPLCED